MRATAAEVVEAETAAGAAAAEGGDGRGGGEECRGDLLECPIHRMLPARSPQGADMHGGAVPVAEAPPPFGTAVGKGFAAKAPVVRLRRPCRRRRRRS